MEDIVPVRYLETKNKTDYDKKIKFEEENHVYYIFNEYLGDYVSKYNGYGMMKLDSVTTILGQFFKSTFEDLSISWWNNPDIRKRMSDPHHPTYGKYAACKSPADIRDVWAEGARLGTKMHNHFEDLGNLLEYDRDHEKYHYMDYVKEHMKDYIEYKFFKRFSNYFGLETGKHKIWRTEFRMFFQELNIAGTIDGLLYDPATDTYKIYDYKRAKGGVKCPPKNPKKPVHKLSEGGRGRKLPSFQCTRSCTLYKYGIQLSLYRRMFENMFPGKKISGLYLIVVDSAKIDKDDKEFEIKDPINMFFPNYDTVTDIEEKVEIRKNYECIRNIYEHVCNGINKAAFVGDGPKLEKLKKLKSDLEKKYPFKDTNFYTTKLSEAFSIIDIPLERHDENIAEILDHRANTMLCEYADTIPKELKVRLRNYLLPSRFDDEESTVCDPEELDNTSDIDCYVPPPKKVKIN